MAEHSAQFEMTSGGLVLTNAILLYRPGGLRSSGHAAAFASIHDVEDQLGRPTIAAGTPLTRAHLQKWRASLDKGAPPEILPENVLVSHPDLLVWWVPEKVRTSYFNLSIPHRGVEGKRPLKALGQRTTLPLPYPAHLFVADRNGLGVYALPTSERPTADEQLLFSPVLNVFIEGRLCWGNVPKPKLLSIASIPEYERAVFDSWSTHPNPGQEAIVTGKGGLVRLWDSLAARQAKRFPVKRLKHFRRRGSTEPVTLGRLVAGRAKA